MNTEKKIEAYSFSCTIRDKVIKFRKWKVKDRKKFIKSLQDGIDVDEKKASESLVYDCLEDASVILSPEEFRYVITKIREVSISPEAEFKFTCSECEEKFKLNLKLNDVIKPVDVNYTDIIVDDISIKIGELRNKEFYNNAIQNCETQPDLYFTDFILHIYEINGNDAMSYIEMVDYIDELDSDVFDKLLDCWDKMKFKVDDINDITCTECGYTEQYMFDDIPDFFPKKWFQR